MTIVLPQGDTILATDDHALMHRVVAINDNSPEQSIVVNSDGSIGIKQLANSDATKFLTTDSNVKLYLATVSSGATWGSITGTLSNQTDLQNALNAKYDASNPSGYISNLSSFNTGNLTEGSNLYFTNARAISALTGQSNAIFTNGAGYLTSAVTSLNSITGAVNLVAGTNITLTPAGQNITISASGGGSSPSIGGTITSGTANSILFVNPTATIAQSADFTYNDTSKNFKFGSGLLQMNKTISGASTTSNFVNITGTLPSTISARTTGVLYALDVNGSTNTQIYESLRVNMGVTSGLTYTGTGRTRAIFSSNTATSTGVQGWLIGDANYSIGGNTQGVTTGHNVGSAYLASGSSTLNLATLAVATSTSNSPALNVGLGSLALNATNNVAGYFGLHSNAPTITQSAAIIANNGATTSPIFVGQVNGTENMRISKDGFLGIRNTAPIADLEISTPSAEDGSIILNTQVIDADTTTSGLFVVQPLQYGIAVNAWGIEGYVPIADGTMDPGVTPNGDLHFNRFSTGDVYAGEGGGRFLVGNKISFFQASTSFPMTMGAVLDGIIGGADFIINAQNGGTTNNPGGSIYLNAGNSTGNAGSDVVFQTATPGASGTATRTANIKWRVKGAGHLLAETDNVYDIGASGATRPRTGYFGTSVISPLVQSTGTMRLAGYTVATLPTGVAGDICYITDGTIIPPKGTAPVGGGTAKGVVFYSGAAWLGI